MAEKQFHKLSAENEWQTLLRLGVSGTNAAPPETRHLTCITSRSFFLSLSAFFCGKTWLRCSRTQPEITLEGPGIPRFATHTHTHRHVQTSDMKLNLQETLGCAVRVGLSFSRRHKLCSHKAANKFANKVVNDSE